MRDRLERLLSAVLVICAVIIAASVAHREFASPTRAEAASPLDRPVFVPAWREAVSTGVEIGDPAAPVKIVEFADLECPFCRGFDRIARDAMRKHPADVSVVFVHYPLESHRFAEQAARAAECAGARGKFSEVVELLYTKQDSLGLKSWGSYAVDAGIKDTAEFKRCALDPAPIKRIDAGKALGAKLHVDATPTVMVNGWKYGRRPPGAEELEQLIQTIRQGKLPFDTTKVGKSD
jgi:protein-disulfide isomerase